MNRINYLKLAFAFAVLILPAYLFAQKNSNDTLQLKTAGNHPMQYFISLPDNWTKEKKWPVVVIIESADKEYKENALRFVRARKAMPFILVAPFNVNNSRQGRRDPKIFPYSEETWDMIDKTGDCKFNMDGITRIVADVQKQYNGEEKYFITGFEAGAHTVWQFLFQHPERLKAAAPVAGNYNQNSCMTAQAFSEDSSLVNLPVRGFSGSMDEAFGPNGIVYYQWKNARQAAVAHGYKNISETTIPGKGHIPLPTEVLSWFYDIWRK
jgi:poly(3-hydroxybutyrate) depolymerase